MFIFILGYMAGFFSGFFFAAWLLTGPTQSELPLDEELEEEDDE
jgi:hypothetical protein